MTKDKLLAYLAYQLGKVQKRITFKQLFHNLRQLKIGRIIETILILVLVAGFVFVAVGVESGQWQIRPILSGSMQPGFPIGGVVVTQTVPTKSLAVGDVAVFYPPFEHTASYVHRIVTLSRRNGVSTITTKGDDNPTADPWIITLKGKSAYVARFTLPLLGYAAVWIHSPTGRHYILVTAIALAIIFITVVALEEINKRDKKIKNKAKLRKHR